MNAEEYQNVKKVFHSVMEIADEGRSAFLDEECLNDPDVRREVERLLNSLDSEFMEGTAVQNVADLLADEESLISGEKVGRYSIINRLGKGGMGEVYLAHDRSLGRDVAIKVLLPEFTTDREHVNRFKFEAKAASALNHPNIVTIYEIGEDNDRLFIAAEHIVGETLRSLISRKGLTLASSIRIAEQVASALTAAHKAGIIHRDIKPENIIVREDGFVKVLDFGLAKPATVDKEVEKKDLVETRKGVVMGSIGYMSPEQARGLRVDARTDLWSIGVILYEIVTGTPPFHGETKTDILANIIHKDPIPVSETIPDAPAELSRIVKKSLRKEADERYQNAMDLALDLKNLRHEMEFEHELEISVSADRLHEIRSRSNDSDRTSGSNNKSTDEIQDTDSHLPITTQTSGENAAPRGRFKTAMIVALGILILGGSGYIGYSYFRPGKLIRTAFNKTRVEKIPIAGHISNAAISPDGKYLAYIAGEIGNPGRLMLRQLETGSEKEILALTGGPQIGLHSFSADGNYFYFYQGVSRGSTRTLRRVALLGGETQELPFRENMYPSFSPDGKRAVMVRRTQDNEANQVVVTDTDGNNEEVVYSSNENSVLFPKFSPDGSKILIAYSDKTAEVGRAANLGWLPIKGGEITRIGDTSWDLLRVSGLAAYYEWLRDGSGVIVSNRLLSEANAQIFLVGYPDGDVNRITNDTSSNENLSATSDSKTIATIRRTSTSGIWEFDLSTTNAKQITVSSNQNTGAGGIAVIDDNKLLFVRADGKGSLGFWQINTDGSDEKLLFSQKGKIEFPFVSAEGKHVYFSASPNSGSGTLTGNAIWRFDADGSHLEQITTASGVVHTLIGVFPDDNSLLFSEWVTDRKACKVQKLDLASGQITPVIDDNSLWLWRRQLSPDGKQILYGVSQRPTEQEPNPDLTYRLVDLDGTKLGKLRLTLPDQARMWVYCFAPDGRSIYYYDFINRADIRQFDFGTQKSTKITNFNLDTIFNFTVSRDGKKLYIVRGSSTDEVVLIKSVE